MCKLLCCILVATIACFASSSSTTDCLATDNNLTDDCVLQINPDEISDEAELLRLLKFTDADHLHEKHISFVRRAVQILSDKSKILTRDMINLFRQKKYDKGWEIVCRLLEEYSIPIQTSISMIKKQYPASECLIDLQERSRLMNPFQLAIAHYYVSHNTQSAKLLEPLLRNSTTLTPMHLLYIHANNKQGWNTSLKIVRDYLAMNPNHFYLHHLEGLLLTLNRSYTQAINSLQKSFKLNHLFEKNYIYIIECHLQLKDLNNALKVSLLLENLSNNIKLNKPIGDIYTHIGDMYQKLKNHSKAEEYLLKAIKHPQGRSLDRQKLTYDLLITVYQSTKQDEKLLTVYALILEIWFKQETFNRFRFLCRDKLNKLNTIKFIQTLKQMNNTASSYFVISSFYSQEGWYQQAIQFADAAIEIYPQSPSPYIEKGLAMCQLNNSTASMEWFRKGIELQDESATYGLVQKSKCLISLGKYAQAKEGLMAAKKKSPSIDLSKFLMQCEEGLKSLETEL